MYRISNRISRSLLFVVFAFVWCVAYVTETQAYVMGMKSTDNSVENIMAVEKQIGHDVRLAAFILDPFLGKESLIQYQKHVNYLSGKVLHFTVSPNLLTAKAVSKWAFDREYGDFFDFVKKNNLKVVFRTMHEMNGNWYPRAGSTQQFKKARIRVWKLSRARGLDSKNILFNFSLNHRDVSGPAWIRCTLENKDMRNCSTREDYRPGDKYVDVIWFTFYNRWKATSNRKRLMPQDILVKDGADILQRVSAKGMPVFIDEVGTTSVVYSGDYSREKSLQVFTSTGGDAKNQRLKELAVFIRTLPNIVGMVYFNVDYTEALSHEIPNEADRIIAHNRETRFSAGIDALFANQTKLALDKLFWWGTITER